MISTDRLTKHYRHRDALHELTLDVPEGGVFALAGPNGAGKSTALKLIMNLIRPSSGSAQVLGVGSTRLGPDQLAQIGYISESQKLPEWMRVGYFLDYCKSLYPSWDDRLASDMIRQYQLPLDRRLHALSRGMKVKALLVASLAYRPRLIVLDEPFSGLDVLVREQLIESLVDCTPAATILLASHDLAEIESFATHVAYLNEGRLRFVQEMDELTARFREIEITLSEPADLPANLPATWIDAERSGVVVRYIDTQYRPERAREEVASRFNAVRAVQTREMSFRAIFLALAKARAASGRTQCA